MKEIKLSKYGKNKGKHVAKVDDEDYDRVSQYDWYSAINGNSFYARRNIRDADKKKIHYLHWDIMGTKWIDHIDGDGLNNQKSNLRHCTRSQNRMNSKINGVGTSVYKGVHFRKDRNKWISMIMLNGKSIRIGTYKRDIDAARAYNNKAIELFGEFASLNKNI